MSARVTLSMAALREVLDRAERANYYLNLPTEGGQWRQLRGTWDSRDPGDPVLHLEETFNGRVTRQAQIRASDIFGLAENVRHVMRTLARLEGAK